MPTLLSFAFRPFFLATGFYGALIVLSWVGFLFAGWPLPVGWSPTHWHSHEMIYGLVPAAIAGFLLTAITNWTGAAPLRGLPLLGLLGLWVLGRVGMWSAGWLPQVLWIIALADLLFLLVLAAYVTTILLLYGNRRNLILVIVLLSMATGNLLMHLGFVRGTYTLLQQGQQLGLGLVALLLAVIAGRITPAFTANWLRQRGSQDTVKRSPWLDRLALGSLALLIPLNLWVSNSALTGGLALASGLINGFRLWQWAGWRAAREPLLWVLHLGYAWLVVALLLRGITELHWLRLPPTLWQHALGVGALGTLVLGVMLRVSLGHTGRPLKLPRFAVSIVWLITLATVLRLLAAMQFVPYRLGITVSATAWFLAFLLFTLLYWPILSRSRIDAHP